MPVQILTTDEHELQELIKTEMFEFFNKISLSDLRYMKDKKDDPMGLGYQMFALPANRIVQKLKKKTL